MKHPFQRNCVLLRWAPLDMRDSRGELMTTTEVAVILGSLALYFLPAELCAKVGDGMKG
jgi:hypothetical protein